MGLNNTNYNLPISKKQAYICLKGELGDIQYLQASHPQDMEGWPEYWERMKPVHYATHVVSPVLVP